MKQLDQLDFAFRRQIRPILQTEATECGLACVGMISNFYGYKTSLSELRSRFPQSLKGSTLGQLIDMAEQLKLGTRPLKIELDEIGQIRLPAIIHWSFDHFVILKSAGLTHYVIVDPAVGQRKVSVSEFSRCFTGIALEAWPSPNFEKRQAPEAVRIGSLWGAVSGLRRSLAQIFVMAACLELVALLLPLLTQFVIDDVLVAADYDLLNVLVIGFLFIIVFQQIISVSRYFGIMYFGTALSMQWKAKVFAHLIRLPTSYFERRHTGDIVSRFGTVDTIQNTVTLSLISGIIDGIVALITCALMIIYSPLLTVIPVGFMFVYAIGRIIRYRPLREATLEETVHSARASSHFLESVRANKTIKLFVRQTSRTNTWLAILVSQINANLKIQKIGIAFHSGNAILSSAENIFVIWLGARLVMDGQFSVGFLVAYIAYKNQFDSKITSLIDKFFEFRLLNVQMERLADIMHTSSEVSSGTQHSEKGLELSDYILQLNSVFFRYSPGDRDVLADANATIMSGESVAIVGASGCGKSTLANLILGLYSPDRGIVSIGAKTIAEIGLSQAREIIGAVLQDDVLFAGSIEENISFFAENPDGDWVRECARMARIDSEIRAMPMGYRSLIGDLGSGLSGGQKQRLMLARAFYKKPKILLLDEATSHLDPTNERLINECIKSLAITRIVIAHREETILSTDRVLELRGGQLIPKALSDLPTKEDSLI